MEEPQILAKTFEWWCEDFQTEEGKCFKVIIWAQTLEDEVISIVIEDFLPVLEVVLPEEFTPAVAETLCANIYDSLRQKLYNYVPEKNHQPISYQGSLRYPLFYYTQDQQICMTLRFKSMEAARHCQNLLQWPVKTSAFGSVKLMPSATKIPMIAKFRTAMGLLPCQWVQFFGTQVTEDKDTKSRREYKVSYKNIKQCKEEDCSKYGDINPSLLVFDYEMFSRDALSFPDEDNADDVVFMEGAIFLSWNKHKGDYDIREFLLVLSKLSKEQFGKIKGSKLIKIHDPSKVIYDIVEDEEREVEVRIFDTELNFLDGCEQLQIELNPTGVIGHNSIEFDHKYHKVRKGRLGEPYQNLSRLQKWIQGFKYIEWSSSAYHDQKIYVPDGPGRIYFDTYKMVQRDYKEDSYNLDVLGQKYLGIGKHKWGPELIFESYKTQDPKLLNGTGVYCMRDVWCTWGLFQHFNFWTSYSNMANVMEVDIFDLFSQGQSVRTRAQTYSTCEHVGHFMHIPERIFRSIAGGHVFDQIPGIYEYLLLLDFMGLYPSIMRKFNVSPDTYDFHKKAKDEDCYILEWKDHQGEWSTRFVKETIRKGILPIQLEHLTDARNLEKKRMAEAKKRGDKKAEMIHNVNQNGYKVSSNSKYGAISQKGGTLGLSEAGAAVTAYGRMLVQKMGKWCEDNGWEVIYGDTDSVMIRKKGGLTDEEKQNFEKIGKNLVQKLNDECFEKPIEVQLDGIMRTFVSLSKKMYTKIALDPADPTRINERLFSSKGFVTSRRDTCLMCRNLCSKMANDVTALKPLDEVLSYISDELDRLLYGEVTTEELITILKLGPEYKNANNMMALYQKHLLENNILVKAGDRLPHVYVKRKNQTKYKGECFEYPEIYEKNKDTMELDRITYLKSQFANKIDTYLHACFPDIIPESFIAKIPGFIELRKGARVLQIMCALMETHMNKLKV